MNVPFDPETVPWDYVDPIDARLAARAAARKRVFVFATEDCDDTDLTWQWMRGKGEACLFMTAAEPELFRDEAEELRDRHAVIVLSGGLPADLTKSMVRDLSARIGTVAGKVSVCPFTGDSPDYAERWALPVADWLASWKPKATANAGLKLIDPTVWQDAPVPARSWHVQDLLPSRTVTKLSGAGGEGKSLLALQLCVSTGTGMPWLGRAVPHGRALYLAAEDDADELQRRLAEIVQAEGIAFKDLENVRIAPLAGLDAVLAAPTTRGGQIACTALWHDLEASVEALQPSLIVVDTLADVFGGDEINRAHARQFISLLRGLAIRFGAAVLVLSHPSLSGIASGKGSSGSTGWDNSVRSALYLQPAEAAEGDVPDPDLRVLKSVKSNYSRAGSQITLRWQHGVFVAVETDQKAQTWLDKKAVEREAEAAFLKLLSKYAAQGRDASALPGRNYAPFLFAKEPDAKGIRRPLFEAAMLRLLDQEKIRVAKVGPASRQRSILVLNDDPEGERDD